MSRRVRSEITKPIWRVRIALGPSRVTHLLRGVSEAEVLERLDRAYPNGYDLDGEPQKQPPRPVIKGEEREVLSALVPREALAGR